MTPSAWTIHKENTCGRCGNRIASKRLCPIVALMDKDPADRRATPFFSRGGCSRFVFSAEAKRQWVTARS